MATYILCAVVGVVAAIPLVWVVVDAYHEIPSILKGWQDIRECRQKMKREHDETD